MAAAVPTAKMQPQQDNDFPSEQYSGLFSSRQSWQPWPPLAQSSEQLAILFSAASTRQTSSRDWPALPTQVPRQTPMKHTPIQLGQLPHGANWASVSKTLAMRKPARRMTEVFISGVQRYNLDVAVANILY